MAGLDIWESRRAERLSRPGPFAGRFREARRALKTAQMRALEALPEQDHDPVTRAFAAIETVLRSAEPPSPIPADQWIIRLLETFDESEIDWNPSRTAVYCPLCGVYLPIRRARGLGVLEDHLRTPHGRCPEPGCGEIVTATALASHRASRHKFR